MKSKGRKCFKCYESGHVASECFQKKSSAKGFLKSGCNITLADNGKPHTIVKIVINDFLALLNTISDLTLIRVQNYAKIRALPLSVQPLKFKSVDAYNMTLGGFSTKIIFCREFYEMTVHVVLDR